MALADTLALPFFDEGHRAFADKLARLPTVMKQWAGREAELTGISLLFNDEVIVRTRTGKPAKPGARA